jgi:hypothetical protein
MGFCIVWRLAISRSAKRFCCTAFRCNRQTALPRGGDCRRRHRGNGVVRVWVECQQRRVQGLVVTAAEHEYPAAAHRRRRQRVHS